MAKANIDLTGRNFLTLKDFNKDEILYLIDLAQDYKDKKKKGIPVDDYRGKNVALIFEPAPDVLLKWLPAIWVWVPLIWILPVPRLEKRKVSQIRPESSEECMTV